MEISVEEYCCLIRHKKTEFLKIDLHETESYDFMTVYLKQKTNIIDTSFFKYMINKLKNHILTYGKNFPEERLNLSDAVACILMRFETICFEQSDVRFIGKIGRVDDTVNKIHAYIQEHYRENFNSADIEKPSFAITIMPTEFSKKAQHTSFSAMVLTVFLAVLMIVIPLHMNCMSLLNLQGEMLTQATTYFRITLFFLPASALVTIFLGILRCYGHTKSTFVISLIKVLVNFLINLGIIKFSNCLPISGIEGFALGYGIGHLVSLLIVALLFVKLKIRLRMTESMKDMLQDMHSILRIGIPAGLSSASFMLSQAVVTAFMVLLGPEAISAKLYFANILSYAYLFSYNLGSANSILIGRRYGAGEFDTADQMNAQLVKLTVLINLVISLLIFFFRYQLVGIFTHQETIIKLAPGVFLIDIITEQARAVSHVYEYALRGVGDVLFSVVILIIFCWSLSIGLSYFLTIKCKMGLIGYWIGLAADETVRAVVTYLRWKNGKWKHQYKGAE